MIHKNQKNNFQETELLKMNYKMIKKKSFLVFGMIMATILVTTHSLKASDDIKPFLGCWALTLPDNVPGWIEIRCSDHILARFSSSFNHASSNIEVAIDRPNQL